MYWKYLKYVLKHKWFVFVECCKLGIPLRGLLHDLSKFLPSEFIPYARYFYGNYPETLTVYEKTYHWKMKNKAAIKDDFDLAWLKHQKRNKHHWQYWLLTMDSSNKEFTIQAMGDGYPMYLSRNSRHLAEFDDSILFEEDKVLPNFNNDNAYMYAKEIQDRLNKSPKVLLMPLKYQKEMLADWRGAGKAINGKDDSKSWYLKNKDNIIIHPKVREFIEKSLGF
jgi:hypothetical protein